MRNPTSEQLCRRISNTDQITVRHTQLFACGVEKSHLNAKSFQAIDSCYRMIALYSQAYVDSKVCQEEFNIAWARGRNENVDLIYPIYLHSAQLPTYMTTLTYRDCRKAKAAALTDACEPLLREIQSRKNC